MLTVFKSINEILKKNSRLEFWPDSLIQFIRELPLKEKEFFLCEKICENLLRKFNVIATLNCVSFSFEMKRQMINIKKEKEKVTMLIF